MAQPSRRNMGGLNNLQGNRYEDLFAVSQLIRLAKDWALGQSPSSMMSQADCPVDDLIVREIARVSHFQVKSGRASWAEGDGKLAKEFRAQAEINRRSKVPSRLHLVVADETLASDLRKKRPKGLRRTVVLCFRNYGRPRDLVLDGPTRKHLAELSASRMDRPSESENLALAFHSAWLDVKPDRDGFKHVEAVFVLIRDQIIPARVRHRWNSQVSWWTAATFILDQIEGFSYWVDRGYFEWKYGREDGFFDKPCESESFSRFAARVAAGRPQSFDDLEDLFP